MSKQQTQNTTLQKPDPDTVVCMQTDSHNGDAAHYRCLAKRIIHNQVKKERNNNDRLKNYAWDAQYRTNLNHINCFIRIALKKTVDPLLSIKGRESKLN